jgi:hypothetical protein
MYLQPISRSIKFSSTPSQTFRSPQTISCVAPGVGGQHGGVGQPCVDLGGCFGGGLTLGKQVLEIAAARRAASSQPRNSSHSRVTPVLMTTVRPTAAGSGRSLGAKDSKTIVRTKGKGDTGMVLR